MLAFDTETALIEEAKLAPEMACLSFSDGTSTDLLHWADPAAPRCAEWLLNQHTTTANGPYDLAVLWAQYPELRDLIWDALVHGRVHDVQTRQKLMDIGEGKYRRVFKRFPGDEKVTKLNYTLSDLHARYFGTFMEKDQWRLKYGELRPYPLDQWPQGAKDYATYDAVATSRVHVAQDEAAAQVDHHNLWDEPYQVRAHFALHLMSCWGIATDLQQVEKVIATIDAEMPELIQRLQSVNLVRKRGKKDHVRNEKLAKEMMYAAVGDAGELTDTGYKKVKAGELNKDEALRAGYIKIDQEWCETSGYGALIDYYHFRQNQLLRSKLEHIRTAASYGLPVQTQFEVLMETGRTSSSENKLISNSMALQNPPRKGGMRECFVARPGYGLLAADYGQAELVSLAQVTYSAFGFSKMRDLLNADMDIHVDFGKEVMAQDKGVKISYAQAWELHKNKDPLMKEMRQMAKCFHGNTEVLTKNGWVKLSELREGVEVMSASFQDEGRTNLRWEKPIRLTTRVAEDLVHLQNQNIDLWVTPDHRMAAWRNAERNPLPQKRDPKTGRMIAQGGKQKNQKLVHEVCMPEELGRKRSWPSAGLCEESVFNIDERWLRLAVAVQADGSYRGKKREARLDSLGRLKKTGKGEKIRLGFTKKRKIERLRWLLEGLPYEEKKTGAAKVTTFFLPTDVSAPIRELLDADKTLPWWWLQLSVENRQTVLDEARYWDGHITGSGRNHYSYTTTIRKNADVLQAIASITNQKAALVEVEKTSPTHATTYKIGVKDRPNTRGGNLGTNRVKWGREVYCLTVPSDAVLVRYGGKTTITHQCADFGFPGGLGWASFQSYARKAWSVELTGQQSKELKRYWLNHFPEMPEYFRWMSDLVEAGGTRASIQQFMSKRWRGKCYYTQGCNTMFQGLTADAAKAALFEVSRRCYSVPSSALYGCRPLLFVHDEIILECPLDQATEAAAELEHAMVEVYSRYTPDVKITADAHLMQRWSKDAEAVHDERGKLVPWQPPQDEDERFEMELMVA